MSEDEALQSLLNRARRNRENLNAHKALLGESPTALRSPLRDRLNEFSTSPTKSTSPSRIKTTPYISPSSRKSPVRTTTSPIRSLATTSSTSTSSPTKTSYTRAYQDKNSADRSEESYDREVTEKKTTIYDDDKRTKTTITEKEETIHKSEILKFEVKGGTFTKSPSKLIDDFRAKRDKEWEKTKEATDSKKSNSILDESADLGRKMNSPSRFGSCRDTSSVVEDVFQSPVRRSRLDISLAKDSPTRKTSPLKTRYSPEKSSTSLAEKKKEAPLAEAEPEDDEEDDGSFKFAQKKRLKALASKFSNYDDEDSMAIKQLAKAAASASPSRRDSTQIRDVDRELQRSRSPIKKMAASASGSGSKSTPSPDDPDFVKSLKAQGFEETSSKSKLVYDFGKNNKNTPGSRDASPYSFHPMQFISVQKNKSAGSPHTPASNPRSTSPVRNATPAYRSASPTRNMASPQRPSSPFKPHPLQFVSPQKANEKPASTSNLGPPAKPARTYAEIEDERAFRSEAAITITDDNTVEDNKTDTASRRSILEKRNLFEDRSPKREDADPAMLPLSQRKALFEKNRGGAPKPIARFGESVTPAMLSRGQSDHTPATRPPPTVPASEPAWKRRRATSPVRPQPNYYTPNPANVRNVNNVSNETPARNPRSGSGFETSKKLFENVGGSSWRDNDIARQQEEAKKKDMDVLLNRFKQVSKAEREQERERSRSRSPIKERSSPSPSSRSTRSPLRSTSPPKATKATSQYPGVSSVKKIKVSPTREGGLYPNLSDIHHSSESSDERPETAMSEESVAPSEAPSLGMAIKRAASANKLKRSPPKQMLAIAESSDDEAMDASDEDIENLLDEALDDSQAMTEDTSGPTPPKNRRHHSPSGASATSWEFATPSNPGRHHDFRTPRVDQITDSPQGELPLVDTEEGPAPATDLIRTVSHYRKQKPNVQVLPKVVRSVNVIEEANEDEEESEHDPRNEIAVRINKLQEEASEQMQRRLQASKALGLCASQNEFEGSYERVEFERLLLEAHHKHEAANNEIKHLKNMGARGSFNKKEGSKGTISISGISLPLKGEFVRFMANPGHGGDDFVHYFLCLVKYRSQVIATQMLSSSDGISQGRLHFSNLIKISDLEPDFNIHVEVYGLQTPKEYLSHEAKYHLKRKDKSMFNLTPFKNLRKNESKLGGMMAGPSKHDNPVNLMNIRKSKFGMVGHTTINIDTLAAKTFRLDNVMKNSPLAGTLEMRLGVTCESNVREKGFLTLFKDINGLGNWCRRWCVLKENTMYFWKYPEDERKSKPLEGESIALHDVFTKEVSLAPRDISSRMNTFMMEAYRPIQSGDREALNVHVDRKHNVTTLRHLLSADTRDERIHWCQVLSKALGNLRAWDPTSTRARSDSVSTTASATSEDTVSSVSTAV